MEFLFKFFDVLAVIADLPLWAVAVLIAAAVIRIGWPHLLAEEASLGRCKRRRWSKWRRRRWYDDKPKTIFAFRSCER